MDLGLLLFWLTSVALWLYLFVARRPIDVFTIAAVSGTLFFLPVYTGVVSRPPHYPTQPVEPELYVAFSGYMLVTLACAFLADRFGGPRGRVTIPLRAYHARPDSIVALTLAALWGLTLAALLWTHGPAFFEGHKSDVISADIGMRQVFDWLSPLLAVVLFLRPSTTSRLAACAVLLATLAAGSRSATAISVVALLLIYGYHRGPVSLARKYRLSAPLLVISAVLAGSLLKGVYGAFRVAGLEGVGRLFTRWSVMEIAAAGAEFMGTQYIFNEIVRTGFRTDGDHLWRGPLSLLPVPRRLYTTGSGEFNELFQPVLFPDRVAGMAYNPFGEAYAALGMAGIAGLLGGIALALLLLHTLLYRCRATDLMPLIAIAAAILAFYAHRNSLGVSMGFTRNVLWPYLGCLAVAGLAAMALPTAPPRTGSPRRAVVAPGRRVWVNRVVHATGPPERRSTPLSG